jgi:hypothetical protein
MSADRDDDAFRDAQLRPRRRWYAVLVAVSLAATAAGFVAWFHYEDAQTAARRLEAHFAGCPTRPECKQRGLCSAPPRERWSATLDCVAATDTDCAGSAECEEHGFCSAALGACRALRDDDCKRSKPCSTQGACSALDGACQIVNNADCDHLEACWKHGECSADHGACRALTPADCARSQECREKGACAPRDGKCLVSDEGCADTGDCIAFGRCGAAGSVCAPRSLRDCTQSSWCSVRGFCALSGDAVPTCQVSAEGCRKSSGCIESGYCNAVAGECVVSSTADCLRSENCKKRGQCTMRTAGPKVACGPAEGNFSVR